MTDKERRALVKQAKSLIASADRKDAIVVCEDGVETNNKYEVWAAYEGTPDTKTPEGWVNGIAFHHSMKNQTCKVSLILKKGAGKFPWEK